MKKLILFGLMVSIFSFESIAQETFPRNDVRDKREGAYALTNGTVVVDYKTTIEDATLLIRNGKVEDVGTGISIPNGYATVDLNGNFVYPSLIDPYTNYGMPKSDKRGGFSWGGPEQINTKTKGAYNANEAIKAEFNASDNFTIDKKTASSLRKAGFGVVATYRADGISRGTSALVSLNEGSDNNVMLNHKASANYSFTKGSSKQAYPISTMGMISLLKQTYFDAQWYQSINPPPFTDLTLTAWNSSQSIPQFFDTGGWLEILRADKLGDEFGVQYIIKGGGDEYQRIKEVKATNAQLIIPVTFPDAYEVDNAFDVKGTSLADMKHWELAPTNPGVLEKNGIPFAFTMSGLTSSKDYWANIRKAIRHGLSEETALKALTYTPAAMLNETGRLGSLQAGRMANFIVTSAPIFDEKMKIHENWIQGSRHVYKPLEHSDYAGKYDLNMADEILKMEISGEPGSQSAKLIINDTTDIKINTKIDEDLVEFVFSPEGKDGVTRLAGWVGSNGFSGKAQAVDGSWMDWSAVRTGNLESDKSEKPTGNDDEEMPALGPIIYPFVAHGNISPPTVETILIKNGTLWTNETEGIVNNTDILLKDGKISKIGKGLSAPGARVIDAEGMHVTSGIIDEHSHIAASSINDISTNSAMVRIGDVIDPTDGHIYTSLSGGVTAVQILHGSANPIGGQSALIKLRWGASPEEMKIKGADGFIKFALGENVKRSRNNRSIRFPQTRMGVEQVYVDAFSSALEYQKKWDEYNKLSNKARTVAIRPRRDLAMDAMNEILNSKRFISCHSYVQSEINMLMKVADDFGFKVNTFTHILEGYKLADKMAAHGAGASTFSDWWAYKWEVRYAIPYNAVIMHNAGVTVAINSDDSEMGRRLNQEAAKSIKYGGMSQEDAWKMVTLNPAKLLHLDNRMGSLKVGKDADVVIWSDNPLSIYANVKQTIIDGKVYYDAEKEKEMISWIDTERGRLIQKMKAAKGKGGKTQKPMWRQKEMFHCDDLTVDINTLND